MADLKHMRDESPDELREKHVGKAAITRWLKGIQPVLDVNKCPFKFGSHIDEAIREQGGIKEFKNSRPIGERAGKQWNAIWFCLCAGRQQKRRATVSFVFLM